MAIQRKNRLNSPTTSPDKDESSEQRSTPPRGPRTTLRALFSTSPTSLAVAQYWQTPPQQTLFPSSSSTPSLPSAAAAAAAASRFNPRLIFAQIVAIQSLHYLILSVLFQVIHFFTGNKITIDRIFTPKYIELWSKEGWYDNCAIILSSVAAAVLLALVVEKSKKCLDFSITLFIIHFVICWLYGGFPASWDWWVIHVLGLIIMVLLGEYFCSRVELREIPLL